MPSRDRRKIVLATNIAETSLTIEGVQVVIDSGLTRRLRYDPSTGMNRLVTIARVPGVGRAAQGQGGQARTGRLLPPLRSARAAGHAAFTPAGDPRVRPCAACPGARGLGRQGPRSFPGSMLRPLPHGSPACSCSSTSARSTGPVRSRTVGRAMARFPLHPRLPG